MVINGNPVKNYRIGNRTISSAMRIIDNAGYFLFGLFKKKGKDFINSGEKRKFLIIRLDDIGDVVLATPFIETLKNKFPDSKIDLLVKHSTKEVLNNNPCINKVFEIEPFWMRTNHPSSIFKILSLVKKLRKGSYNTIFELRGHPLNILFAYLCGGMNSAGYSSQGLGFLLTNAIVERKRKHQVERNLDILRRTGIDCDNISPRVMFSKQDRVFADEFFKKNGLNKKRFVVAIHAGAPWAPKRWPGERFSELSDRIIEKFDARVLFIGSRKEKPLINRIIERMRNNKEAINLAGMTSLGESEALLSKSSLFIGNDSGPMHISSAVGTPTIALFWGEGPSSFGPYGKNNEVIFKKDKCYGNAVQRMGKNCACGSTPCKALLNIHVDDVFKVVKKYAISMKNLGKVEA